MIKRSLSVLLLTFIALSAAGRTDSPPSEALLQDAAAYAARFGVDVDEAVRRLRLQREIGDLDAALTEEEQATFAGLWIEHEPRYRVVVRFTDPASERRLHVRIAGGPLAQFVDTKPARWTLAQLQAQQQEIRTAARRAGVKANSDINVYENRVELQVVDPQQANVALASMRMPIPPAVEITGVEALAVSQADLTGGSPLSTCTAGFFVLSPHFDAGVLTAGHCADQQSFEGLSLPFRAQDVTGDQDVQWHSSCGIKPLVNRFNSGIDFRHVERTRSRSEQPLKQWVCKYGKATGRTCGVLESKSYDPGTAFNGTFMLVEGGNVNLSEEGDSGGPWFVEFDAYGIQSGAPNGGNSNDAYYMAINYVSSLGVSVLTTSVPVGQCNTPPVASFTGGARFDGRATFNASNSFDPDGYIVRWDWNFDDGTTGVSTTPYITHVYPPDSGTYYVTLIVTDNEGKRASTSREICVPMTACYEPPLQ
jgi:streptogrisin C